MACRDQGGARCVDPGVGSRQSLTDCSCIAAGHRQWRWRRSARHKRAPPAFGRTLATMPQLTQMRAQTRHRTPARRSPTPPAANAPGVPRALRRYGRHAAHRQLGQRDHADHDFVEQICRVVDAPTQDHRRCVEHPSRRQLRGHSVGSMTVSMSRRNMSGSTRGSPFLRSMSSAGVALRRGSGRNSAIARPSRVTITHSPRSTRSSTSAPLLRRSPTVTDSTAAMSHR